MKNSKPILALIPLFIILLCGKILVKKQTAFFETRAELLADGFPKIITDWGKNNKVQVSGHCPGNYDPQMGSGLPKSDVLGGTTNFAEWTRKKTQSPIPLGRHIKRITLPYLDNLFRFLSGTYFGLGLLMTWVIFNVHQTNHLIYFIGIVVVVSGLGRLYSKIKVGSAGKYPDNIMLFEIALGVGIILLQYFR